MATSNGSTTLITMFTPVYNRAHLLRRVYDSLLRQTYRHFEWLVVDDGSSDASAQTVTSFIAEGRLDIRLISQSNGGKHRAINRGAREARGSLFFILDSDDWLTDDALATVAECWQRVEDDPTIGGVCGRDIAPDGTPVSSELPQDELVSNSLDIRLRHHVSGDLKEVFRTSVLRQMPFPEYPGERFCPEALLWNRIAQHYNLLYINRPIYVAEYQPEGLTARIVQIRCQSPVATTTCYAEMLGYRLPLAQKIRAAINYWRFSCCLPPGARAPRIPLPWHTLRPAGTILHLIECGML